MIFPFHRLFPEPAIFGGLFICLWLRQAISYKVKKDPWRSQRKSRRPACFLPYTNVIFICVVPDFSGTLSMMSCFSSSVTGTPSGTLHTPDAVFIRHKTAVDQFPLGPYGPVIDVDIHVLKPACDLNHLVAITPPVLQHSNIALGKTRQQVYCYSHTPVSKRNIFLQILFSILLNKSF